MVRDVRVVFVTTLAAVMLVVGGCATFHDLYFERADLTDVYLDQYRVALRIFSHKDQKVEIRETDGTEAVDSNDSVDTPYFNDTSGFHVSVQVVSPQLRDDSEEWTQDPEQVSARADQFLDQVSSEYRVDSLALNPVLPERSEAIIILHDGESFSPRRDDYFTLQFGRINIPKEIQQVRAVLHVTRTGAAPTADSVSWMMNRVDFYERGLAMFRSGARGYE